MTHHKDSNSPFSEKPIPRLTWREFLMIIGVAGMCATTWAATQARLTEMERRQNAIEDAVKAIGPMQRDIEWIRRELERSHP